MVQAPTPEMAKFRQEIDELDVQISALLGKRVDVIRRVAPHKKAHGIDAVLDDRVDQVIENAARLAVENNFDPELARALYTKLVKFSCDLEETVINPWP